MALNITTAAEVIQVEHVCFTIYSQPGLGKTTLAFTAANPLLLDFDKGAYRAVDRKDVVQVTNWSDVADMTLNDLEGYDTIIIDTVGKALEVMAADIIASSRRFAYGDALNQQGWGQLGIKFRTFLAKLKRFGKDVILIAHMDEKTDGEGIKERLSIQGGSKNLVLTDSDVIARISVYNNERHLMFSPTETSFGKDPANLRDVVIPAAQSGKLDGFLAETITSIKEGLNSLSAAQVERKLEVDWFTDRLPEVKDPEGINELLGRAKKAGKDVSMMLVSRAEEIGLIYDPDAKQYVYLEDAESGERENHPDETMAAE